MTSSCGLSFTTTMWVIDWVHDNTTNLWPSAKVAACTGLAQGHVHVVFISQETDCGIALTKDHSHLARRQAKSNIVAFLSNDGGSKTSTADKLSTAAKCELDIVYCQTKGNVLKWKSTTSLERGSWSANDHGTNGKSLRGEDVTLLTVCIEHQCNVCTAVRIIFNCLDCAGDTVLVALEINDSVCALMRPKESRPAVLLRLVVRDLSGF